MRNTVSSPNLIGVMIGKDVRPRRVKRMRKLGEPLELKEAAAKLGWSYHTTLRHFEHVPGVIIKQGKKKRKITIPVSVLDAEYLKLTTRPIDAVGLADRKVQERQELKAVEAV